MLRESLLAPPSTGTAVPSTSWILLTGGWGASCQVERAERGSDFAVLVSQAGARPVGAAAGRDPPAGALWPDTSAPRRAPRHP
jgi:hypothetical protein